MAKKQNNAQPTYLCFGKGDIGVMSVNGTVPRIEFSRLNEACKVGKDVPDGVAHIGSPLVIMTFTKTASIDVLIRALDCCKESMKLPPELGLAS